MLFGHIGISLGLALGAEKALRRRALFLCRSEQVREVANPSPPAPRPSRLATAAALIDYRLVLLGSTLPDIIDKPVGIYFLGDTFSNGRIFGHSLLFFLIILLAGLYSYLRSGRLGILVLSLCTGFHLVLDQMWIEPRTLFWPLYGLAFPRYDTTGWLTNLIETLKSEPAVFIPEIMGAVIMILFMVVLLRSRSLLSFLRNGMVQYYTASGG
ncbi:metal-dependent hydrolase [Dehalococcoidia bacterium]|nr:metal-dependent hydrolase [Dehalococcoidia bacterium]